MFEGILPSNLNILAFTASNSTEPSWGTYCDDPNLDTCLGDLFSTNWMEDSDKEDLTAESLQKQFKIVKKMTDLSNVMKYGDERIFSEVVANFQGKLKPDRNKQIRSRLVNVSFCEFVSTFLFLEEKIRSLAGQRYSNTYIGVTFETDRRSGKTC
jgi:hypothetical protein